MLSELTDFSSLIVDGPVTSSIEVDPSSGLADELMVIDPISDDPIFSICDDEVEI